MPFKTSNGQTAAERRAFSRLDDADAKLKATLRGVVYGPGPRHVTPLRVRMSRNECYGAAGVVLLVLVGLILLVGM